MAYIALLVLHVVGFAVGVGAATASDPLFVGSIRNRRITSDQFVLLHSLSWVVVGGLTLAVLSGIGLVWLDPVRLQEGGFLAKMTIVFVIAADGAIFHLKVLPLLEDRIDEVLTDDFVADKLPLLAATGATSSVSWYSALILGVLLRFEVPFGLAINVYLVLVVGAAIVAYLVLDRVLFSPQPEPEEVVEKQRFEWAFGWFPAVLAVLVVVIIGIGVVQMWTADDRTMAAVEQLEGAPDNESNDASGQ